MKKRVNRYFRYIRHRVCRFIYYFDQCPQSYCKNYKELILKGLACSALCFVGVMFFVLLILMA